MFEQFPTVIFGIGGADTLTLCVMLLVFWAPRFAAVRTFGEIGGEDDRHALHCAAIALAIP